MRVRDVMGSREAANKKEGAALDDSIDRNGIGEPSTQPMIQVVEPCRVFECKLDCQLIEEHSGIIHFTLHQIGAALKREHSIFLGT